MFEALALTAVLASGPQLPDAVDKGTKHHNGASLHTGVKYVARHERLRRCIRARESNNYYNAVSRTGKYRGAYQFNEALKTGAAWMIQKQLRSQFGRSIAIEVGRALRAAPMNQWNMYWQDRAFWTIWRNGKGRAHWAATVPGTECN